jgi:UDP-2,4-diacetamido-2,4,6-trideoxy-beta-L-altropyranose hydrolase
MRCLALAQAWQDAGGHAVFAMAESTPAIQTRLASEVCPAFSIPARTGSTEDAEQTIDLAREQRAEWLVVDGYQFNADYQRALKEAGLKLLFLDDYGHARQYPADIILNQNLGASDELYQNREPQTRLLLGPRYCLLRREFAAWREWSREVPPIGRRLLVMMGGSDPEKLTARVLEALASGEFADLETMVVVGGSNPHFAMLQGLAVQSGRRITVRNDVSNVAELMAAADVAVSAAGTTCWEICLLGLPALLFDVAANQTAVARELDRRGCAVHVGNQRVAAESIVDQLARVLRSCELRRSLSISCRQLVDGDGAGRVVSILRGTEGFRLRRARTDDSDLLWKWANDPGVRAASFSTAPIPWETHVAWLTEKLASDKSLLLIAEDERAIPFAQIRFDFRQNGEADLNISLAREKRGCGLAVPVIRAGVRELLASSECGRVHAFVKPENVASARAFERANFVRVGLERVGEHPALHFICDRS